MKNKSLDTIVEYLEIERNRRVNAVKSNMFCDNDTSVKIITVLTCSMEKINDIRGKLKC